MQQIFIGRGSRFVPDPSDTATLKSIKQGAANRLRPPRALLPSSRIKKAEPQARLEINNGEYF
jgi:hypothetical protein